MPAPITIYLGLGSNLGDRRRAVAGALAALVAHGVAVQRVSPLYDTDYVGSRGPQPAYLNAVVEAHTELEPLALLEVLQRIEAAAGRAPHGHDQPRRLDIDILWYGDREIDLPGLVVPHPRLAERRFVLQPLHDLGALADRPALRARLRALEAVQEVRPAGELSPGAWRAASVG